MDIDTELITAQEFEWVVNNEPTFRIDGNSFIGKVGKTPSGEDIRIKITLPDEFYPVVKPEVKVLTNISHPNINPDGTLALQILEEWEPRYRLKHVISATRRLFLKSRQSISTSPSSRKVSQPPSERNNQVMDLQDRVETLQKEINEYNQKINNLKSQRIEKMDRMNSTQAVPISPEVEYQATKRAIDDLLSLIAIKFEEADIDEITYFRLFRKYIRKYYLTSKKLKQKGGQKNELSTAKKTTEGPLRN